LGENDEILKQTGWGRSSKASYLVAKTWGV